MTRVLTKNGIATVTRNADAFGYNARGEMVFSRGDAENAEGAYAYDHIGNAVLAASGGVTNACAANALNQYTQVGRAAPCPPARRVRPIARKRPRRSAGGPSACRGGTRGPRASRRAAPSACRRSP